MDNKTRAEKIAGWVPFYPGLDHVEFKKFITSQLDEAQREAVYKWTESYDPVGFEAGFKEAIGQAAKVAEKYDGTPPGVIPRTIRSLKQKESK